METQNSSAAIEPLLIYCDEQSIIRQTQAVERTFPLAKEIFDAWHAIPGLQPLNALAWIDLFSDTSAFVQSEAEHFYEVNYADSHRGLGIGQEKGMDLIHDKLPVFDGFVSKVNEFRNTFDSSPYMYVHYDAFTVNDDGEFVVNQNYVDRFTRSAKLIFETKTEMAAKEAIENLVNALNNLNKAIPPFIFKLQNGVFTGAELDLNQLKDLIEVTKVHGEIEPLIKPSMKFFRSLHGAVVQNNLP